MVKAEHDARVASKQAAALRGGGGRGGPQASAAGGGVGDDTTGGPHAALLFALHKAIGSLPEVLQYVIVSSMPSITPPETPFFTGFKTDCH